MKNKESKKNTGDLKRSKNSNKKHCQEKKESWTPKTQSPGSSIQVPWDQQLLYISPLPYSRSFLFSPTYTSTSPDSLPPASCSCYRSQCHIQTSPLQTRSSQPSNLSFTPAAAMSHCPHVLHHPHAFLFLSYLPRALPHSFFSVTFSYTFSRFK